MQMNRSVSMGCTMLMGTQKKGVLKPDHDGYYTVVLGAYGAYNSAGMFYDLQSAVPFFQQGSPLMRMLEKGVLRGEYKHPEKQGGQSDQAFIGRIRQIDSDRVAFHIRNLRLEPGQKDEKGRPVTVVIGEVRPSGPYGQVLKDALDNPHENVYFSVRSLTVDDMMRGVKYTRDIVTWDFVNEGGIYNANKYYSPALESFSQVEVTPTMLWGLAEEQRQQKASGMESNAVDYESLAADLGWSKGVSKPSTPSYLDW